METIPRVGWLINSTKCSFSSSQSAFSPIFSPNHRPHAPRIISVSVSKISPPPLSEVVEEEDDVLQMFFKERELNGDFISKASDIFWRREVLKFVDSEAGSVLPDPPQQSDEVEIQFHWGHVTPVLQDIHKLSPLFLFFAGRNPISLGARDPSATRLGPPLDATVSDDEGGFLKLTRTQEWISGDNSAPINRKAIAKALQDDRERRKKLSLLEYEAIKRELLLLSVSIGTACTGYCLIAFSLQAAISYATGVLFSCLYLQLLYRHADNLSKETIPQIFMKKKSKKIGIRSDDLENFFERTFKGSSVALSSPRLVIPAVIYGLWVLSHRYLANDFFDFQIVPAMFGLFAYKAAALVQVYRDNEDLELILPDN